MRNVLRNWSPLGYVVCGLIGLAIVFFVDTWFGVLFVIGCFCGSVANEWAHSISEEIHKEEMPPPPRRRHLD